MADLNLPLIMADVNKTNYGRSKSNICYGRSRSSFVMAKPSMLSMFKVCGVPPNCIIVHHYESWQSGRPLPPRKNTWSSAKNSTKLCDVRSISYQMTKHHKFESWDQELRIAQINRDYGGVIIITIDIIITIQDATICKLCECMIN